MNRYSTTLIIQTESEKRRYASTIFSPVPASVNDRIIRITSAERLDKLALDFYGDATWWPVIASTNQIKRGTLVIPANTRLLIPSAESAEQFLTNISGIR